MSPFAVVILLLGLSLGVVDGQCPSQNLVDSRDNRFSWTAVVNGVTSDSLLNAHDETVIRTKTAPNIVRMNIRITYAALKPQTVTIETKNAVLVKLQDYALKEEISEKSWHVTRFLFKDEDKLADQLVFIVIGTAGKVEIKNVYAQGCLQINPCASYLINVFENLKKDFFRLLNMPDSTELSQLFTEKAVVLDDGKAILQGKDGILKYYMNNTIVYQPEIRVLKAILLSETRAYTVHQEARYKSNEKKELKEPTQRVLTLWSKEGDVWKIDVTSRNQGPDTEK